MKPAILMMFLAGCIQCVTPLNAGDMDAEHRKRHFEDWSQFLAEKLKIGDSEKRVDKFMTDYSNKTYLVNTGGGTGFFRKYYIVDDCIQVVASFERPAKLCGVYVERRGEWLLFPNGQAIDIAKKNELPAAFEAFLDSEAKRFAEEAKAAKGGEMEQPAK